MNILRNTLRALLPAAALLLWTGCSADDEAAAPGGGGEGETVTVPLTIDLARTWTTGDDEAPESRDVPNPPALDVDGWAETVGTDCVRIVTFRRRSTDAAVGGDGSTNTAPFLYDPSNDYTWDVIQAGNGTGADDRFYAEGSITKRYGFEYRVVGIAYSSSRTLSPSNGLLPAGEAGLFSLNLADGLTYDSFMASLTETDPQDWKNYWGGTVATNANRDPITVNGGGRLVYTPQFFYGYCHAAGSDDPIIKYAELNAETGEYVANTPLTGTLYRGVAKVEMHITARDREFFMSNRQLTSAFIVANNVRTSVGLTSYDDFLPQAPGAAGNTPDYSQYTLVAAHDRPAADGKEMVLTAYMLPTKTRFAFRCYYHFSVGVGVEYNRSYNYPLSVANISSAEAATGVIAPDVQGDVFYLRRNHKYVFKGDMSTITQTELD